MWDGEENSRNAAKLLARTKNEKEEKEKWDSHFPAKHPFAVTDIPHCDAVNVERNAREREETCRSFVVRTYVRR